MKKKPGRKPTPEGQIKWDIKRRLEYIEFHVYWEGPLARKHLAETFGISLVQATKDLSLYKKHAPDNLEFDPSTKRYGLSDFFKPQFISTDPQAYLAHLAASKTGFFSVENSFPGEYPNGEVIPVPFRKIEHEVLRKVVLAIKRNEDIEIKYQSISSPKPIWRWIAPHAFSFDGHRWHARSFCHMSKTYKDFLLARMLEMGETKPSSTANKNDSDWHKKVTIQIGPNPDLSEAAKRVVMFDYDMQDGIKEIPVRKASLLYFYKNMRFDIPRDQMTPQEQQVVLLNRKDVVEHFQI